MSAYKTKFSTVFSIVITVILMVSSQVVMAQGNSAGKGNGNGNGNGKNKNIGVGNASDGIMGRVRIDKGIVYTGDPLLISLQFPRGSELIANGDVDAYVVIFAPAVDEEDDSSDDGTTDDGTTDDGTTDAGISPHAANRISADGHAVSRRQFWRPKAIPFRIRSFQVLFKS